MGIAMSASSQAEAAAGPQGPWQPDEFLAERLERGRRLLAESEDHQGDVDLQAGVGPRAAARCRRQALAAGMSVMVV